MAERHKYFDLISAQRYFHLIAIKAEKNFSLSNFWNGCGIKASSLRDIPYENPNFKIEHSRILTDIRFYNGEKDFSLNGNNSAPFQYDLFAMHLIDLNIFVFGFPFKLLAKTLLTQVINENNLLKSGAFLKCDLNKLIKLNKENIVLNTNFNAYFSGLDLLLSGDTNITSVGLDGDKPLESALFKQYFEKRIMDDECLLDKCSIKCETIQVTPTTRSNIHVDINGNFKLYIHGSGNNIFTIPYLFKTLAELETLNLTITNPITKADEE